MIIKLIQNYLKRPYINRIKVINRGYTHLKRRNDIGYLRRIRSELVDIKFSKIQKSAKKDIFGESLGNAELLIRQYLLEKNTGNKLNRAILYYLGKPGSSFIYPLPKEWRILFLRKGFKINNFLCKLNWIYLIVLEFLKGIFLFFNILFRSAPFIFKSKNKDVEPYVFFDSLSIRNLPIIDNKNPSYDIFNWYYKWSEHKSIELYAHDIPNTEVSLVDKIRIENIGGVIPPIKYFHNILIFKYWYFKIFFFSILELLRGNWWSPLIFHESIKSRVIKLSSTNDLAKDYLFHYSANVYRPMWTYEAQAKGSRIICYFYSTFEQMKLPTGYESQKYELGSSSWPICLVWDNYHAELIKREFEPNIEIKIVRPIWFTDSKFDIPNFPKNSIAVFDIQSHRRSIHFGISTLAEFYHKYPNLDILFLDDVYSVLSKFNLTMALKRKRHIGNKSLKSYNNYIKRLQTSEFFIEPDPQLSPKKIMEHCIGVISIPFTSASHYCPSDIPNIYYDPTGWIQKDDRASHGIPIISGRNELESWILAKFRN